MPANVSSRSLASGLLLVGIGAFMAYSGRTLPLTSGGNMGPGYFPAVLSALLAGLGLAIVFTGRRPSTSGQGEGSDDGRAIPWRGIALITTALVAFAVSVRPLGLGPSLGAAVFVASLASRRWRAVPALLLTALLVAAGWGVFIRLLGMPVAFLGPLLR